MHILLLNKRLKDDATTIGDRALQSLCRSCQEAAVDLFVAVDKPRVKDRRQKWESMESVASQD